jgi:hypothetical protein
MAIHEDIDVWCEFHKTVTQQESWQELTSYWSTTCRLRDRGATMKQAEEFMEKGVNIYEERFGEQYAPF